jgi:hypothetical protein
MRGTAGFHPLFVRRLTVMWNPAFSPSSPELRSNAVDVLVLATGQVLVASHGQPNRMRLWVKSRLEEAGIGGARRVLIAFPFTIEGL